MNVKSFCVQIVSKNIHVHVSWKQAHVINWQKILQYTFWVCVHSISADSKTSFNTQYASNSTLLGSMKQSV